MKECPACGFKASSKSNLLEHIMESAENLLGFYGKQITKDHILLMKGILIINDNTK